MNGLCSRCSALHHFIEVKAENRPFDTVIKGVDDPWDVCLMQFFWLHTNASVSHNMRDFKNAGMFK